MPLSRMPKDQQAERCVPHKRRKFWWGNESGTQKSRFSTTRKPCHTPETPDVRIVSACAFQTYLDFADCQIGELKLDAAKSIGPAEVNLQAMEKMLVARRITSTGAGGIPYSMHLQERSTVKGVRRPIPEVITGRTGVRPKSPRQAAMFYFLAKRVARRASYFLLLGAT
jgi:hypothetical protein